MPTVDPFRYFTAEQIAAASECPVAAVRENWPKLVEQLDHCKINDRPTQVAMIATVAIETASSFRPVEEAFYLGEPRAEQHRRTLPYYPFYGRGYIQLTHRSNYEKYGPKIAALWGTPMVADLDLAANPARALDPDISAAVSALYFRDHGGDNMGRIPAAARVGDWREVRRLVQGGAAGLDRLELIAGKLSGPVNEPGTGQVYHFPVQGYTGKISLHWDVPGAVGGTDIFAPKGTPVVAIADGTVVYRVENTAMGGNAVQIEHDTDGMQSYYAHGDRAPAVQMGQKVKAGDFLFGVGDSGNAAGKGHHLHFGMGRDINSGSGVNSGLGTDFDAVGLLRSLLAAPPKPGVPDPAPADELAVLRAENARLQQKVDDMVNALAYLGDDKADALQSVVDELRRVRVEQVGPRPAA